MTTANIKFTKDAETGHYIAAHNDFNLRVYKGTKGWHFATRDNRQDGKTVATIETPCKTLAEAKKAAIASLNWQSVVMGREAADRR